MKRIMRNRVEIIAHRGESAEAPENTLAAFRLAWERQADAVECDVHQTRDGHLIVCHDADTLRTTGAAHVIRDTMLAELQQLDVGSWKGAPWAGERLPLLADVLATIPDGARCFIELKAGMETVPALLETISQSGKCSEQLAIISFHADVIGEVKRRLPELRAYLLASLRFDPTTKNWIPSIESLLVRAAELDADGLDLSFQGNGHAFEQAVQVAVQHIHAAGLECYVWTVDDLDAARKLAAFGVDGITTNRAAWLTAGIRDKKSGEEN